MLRRALSPSEGGAEVGDPVAVLFPWFSLLVGLFLYYAISRHAHGIPYTAAIFVLGAFLGHFSQSHASAVADSTTLWLGIDGEVMLLSFLPGLLFLDSYGTDVYLFKRAFSQLLVFAFPMVLGGTFLTALGAYHLLPYDWSFDLCLTFGAVLTATDPVAVAVLLNELGAPARLRIHVAGESLLNDGSAVVFYRIFSRRFFRELGVGGFGEDVDWRRGLVLFAQLSLGGMVVGVCFGVGLVTLLFNFNRRLSKEENVIQVSAMLVVAYLSFFTAEMVCHCSGIIAVVFCGLVTRTFGETLLNDVGLARDFWRTTEHLLNTLLFALGGAVWARSLSSSSASDVHYFGGADWLYLLLLFGMVLSIRFILIFAFYPVTSKIGIGQSWREAVFMSYGGLRGTVGIALVLLLSAEVFKYTETESISEEIRSQYREFANKLCGLVGGISFLTLIVLGPSSGPLLRFLGLVTPTDTRTKVIGQYVRQMRRNTLVEYFALVAEERFCDVDFAVVKKHVSPLGNICADELEASAAKYRRMTGKMPNVASIVRHTSSSKSRGVQGLAKTTASIRNDGAASRTTTYNFSRIPDTEAVQENRRIFINLLRQEYHHQLRVGELDSRGFIPHCLLRSLDEADGVAAQGQPLNDWAASQMETNTFARKADWVLHAYRVGGMRNGRESDRDFQSIRSCVLSALCFVRAHLRAQETFKAEFASVMSNELTLDEKIVVDESKDQVSRANAAINAFDAEDVQVVKSQYICQVLLHKSASYFEKLAANGLMTEREAGGFLEKYDSELRELRVLSELKTQIRKMSDKRRAPTRIAPECELGRLDGENSEA